MKLGVNCISGTVQLAALAIMVHIEFDSIRKNTVSRCAPFETLFPADAIQSGFNSTRRVSLAIGFSTTIAPPTTFFRDFPHTYQSHQLLFSRLLQNGFIRKILRAKPIMVGSHENVRASMSF